MTALKAGPLQTPLPWRQSVTKQAETDRNGKMRRHRRARAKQIEGEGRSSGRAHSRMQVARARSAVDPDQKKTRTYAL